MSKPRYWLVELRAKQGYTQKAVTKLTGISQGYLSRIEGGAQAPGPATAQKLADLLGFDVTRFSE